MTEISLTQYLFVETWAPLTEAMKSSPQFVVEDINGSPQDVMTFLSGNQASLVFVSLNTKEDLLALAHLVKMAKKIFKDKPYKFIAVNLSGNKTIEKALLKLGILDIIEDTIKPRALRYKIDFWMKSLAHSLKTKNITDSNKKEIKLAETNASMDKKAESAFWLPEISCRADVWLIRNVLENNKRILGRWLIKMCGPSPLVSSWVDIPGEANTWRFSVKDSHKELLNLSRGEWVFKGENKPDYNWKEHIWLFTCEKGELTFHEDNKVFKRFYIEDKNLRICKNSEFAKSKQEIIFETFNQEIIQRNDEVLDPADKNISTENHETSYLSGKSNQSSDVLSDLFGRSMFIDKEIENLSGFNNSGLGELSDLSGIGSTDQIKEKSLSGNVNIQLDDRHGADILDLLFDQEQPKSLYEDHAKNEKVSKDLSGKGKASDHVKSQYQGKLSSTKETEVDIYHPSSTLDDIYDSLKKSHSKNSDNTLPILTSLKKHEIYEDLGMESEAEDDSIAGISQDAKIYSFISQGPIKKLCELDDHFENLVILRVIPGDFMELETVQVDLSFHYKNQKTNLKVQGVIELIYVDENSSLITARIQEDQLNQFVDFMNVFQKRQRHINTFMRMAKGL